jgi:hypothetical protein
MYSNTTGADNTATGRHALYSNETGFNNTATGDRALFHNTTGNENTAAGVLALFSNTTGDWNTATGRDALRYNTTGYQNTANGYAALLHNSTGYQNTAIGSRALLNSTEDKNTAIGHQALEQNSTGDGNTAIGRAAGFANTTGHNSIFINNLGQSNDTHTIKIGTQNTQSSTFIAGIRGITTANANAIAVLIDSAGQLGTVSSSRAVKQDIEDLGALADRLLELRPVAFRYKQHAAGDPDTPLQFGLIAEEVAEVFPELVVFDQEGRPETVKYHLLGSLLLGELQNQQSELRLLRARLASIEEELREPSGFASIHRVGESESTP